MFIGTILVQFYMRELNREMVDGNAGCMAEYMINGAVLCQNPRPKCITEWWLQWWRREKKLQPNDEYKLFIVVDDDDGGKYKWAVDWMLLEDVGEAQNLKDFLAVWLLLSNIFSSFKLFIKTSDFESILTAKAPVLPIHSSTVFHHLSSSYYFQQIKSLPTLFNNIFITKLALFPGWDARDSVGLQWQSREQQRKLNKFCYSEKMRERKHETKPSTTFSMANSKRKMKPMKPKSDAEC